MVLIQANLKVLVDEKHIFFLLSTMPQQITLSVFVGGGEFGKTSPEWEGGKDHLGITGLFTHRNKSAVLRK